MEGTGGMARSCRAHAPSELRSFGASVVRVHPLTPKVRALTPTAEGARSKRVKVCVRITEGLPYRIRLVAGLRSPKPPAEVRFLYPVPKYI